MEEPYHIFYNMYFKIKVHRTYEMPLQNDKLHPYAMKQTQNPKMFTVSVNFRVSVSVLMSV